MALHLHVRGIRHVVELDRDTHFWRCRTCDFVGTFADATDHVNTTTKEKQ